MLAVDLGSRRIGLAVSDPLGLTAQGLPSLERGRDAVAQVLEVCRAWEVTRVVVGLPLNMDGSRGPAAEEAGTFAAELASRGGLPVELLDERLSSAQAERVLIEAGVSRSRRRRRGLVDRGAAVLLLDTYLRCRDPRGPDRGGGRRPGPVGP